MDKSGTVTLDELREGLAKQGSPITQREVEQLMESIDVDATGSIEYDEFLAATINMSQLQVSLQVRLSCRMRLASDITHLRQTAMPSRGCLPSMLVPEVQTLQNSWKVMNSLKRLHLWWGQC